MALHRSKPAQLEVQNRIGLNLVDIEEFHQTFACLVHRRRATNQRNDLIQQVKRLDVTAQNVGFALRFSKAIRRTTLNNLDLVGDPVTHKRIDGQRAGHSIHERDHVGTKGVLQLGVLVKVVEHYLRHCIALEHNDQALAGATRGLITNIRDAGNLAVLDQFRNLERQVVGVDLVRKFGDHEALAALQFFHIDDGTHGDRATPGPIRLIDAATSKNHGAGGEVWSLDALDQRLGELFP